MTPQTPQAAGIVYLTNGRVLLLLRSAKASAHPSTWGFPAGGIEAGETPEEAASRESFEETGHAPQMLTPIGAPGNFALFLARGEDFQPVLNDEHEGFVWAPIDQLPQPLHPGCAEQIAGALMNAKDDQVAMDESARFLDSNGWIEVRRNPLSKVGVFNYTGRQVGDSTNPDKVYRVYRPAEELAAPECLESFRLLPWIDNHVMLGHEDDGLMPAERKGVQGVIGEDVSFDGETLFGNLKVFSHSLASLIEAGKRELSCGYRCTYDFTPGVFRGEAYDSVQRTIRGNHLALVHSGRMGPGVAVLDSADDQSTPVKEPPMADDVKDEGGSGMTLEAALEAFKQFLPAFEMLQRSMSGAPAEAALVPVEVENLELAVDPSAVVAVAADADPDKKDDKPKADDKKADDDKPKKEDKKESAMDESVQFKAFAGQLKRREALAGALAKHVGTFDHSDMTEAEVAKYGVKKLGIKAPAGQELTALQSYMLGRGDPSKAVLVTTGAMDAAPSDNFVTRYIQKGV